MKIFLENRDPIIENLTTEKILIDNTKIEVGQKFDEESIEEKNKGDKITETNLQNNGKLDQIFERDELEEIQNFHEKQKCDEESIEEKNKGDKITETDLQNNSKLDQNFERDKLEETQNFHEEHYDGKASNNARIEKREPIIRTQTIKKIFSENKKT